MNAYHIGRLVKQERKKRGVTLNQLSRGIFSQQMLAKLEVNASESDNLLVDILLQRLGRSPDKLEIFMPLSEYKKIKARDMIEELILQNKVPKAEYLLNRYREVLGKENNVHMMYYNRTKAYLLMRNGGAIEEAMRYIEEALSDTLAGWDEEELSGFLISTYEMENLLAYGKLLYMSGKREEAQVHLEKCLEYIEHHYIDTEEFAKIYPKCVWLLSKVCFESSYDEKIVSLCERALDILRREAIGYFAIPVMEETTSRYRRMGNESRALYWQKFYDTIKGLYDEYVPDMCQNSLFFNVCQREYHLDYETIRGDRLAKGYTQENLIDGIFESVKSLSLIENHKKSPSKKHYEQIMGRLGLEKRRYNGLLATDSFDVLQKKNVLDYFICACEFENAHATLEEIHNQLDEGIEDNNRFIEAYQTCIDRASRRITPEIAYERCKKILEQTYNVEMDNNRPPMRNEAMLINQIGICLGELNREAENLELLRKVMMHYEKSKVDVKYNVRSYMLLSVNYMRSLYDSEKVEQAMHEAKKSMSLELKFAKTRKLSQACVVLACGKIGDAGFEEKCREYLKKAYYIHEFNYEIVHCSGLADFYKEIYKEDII